MSDKSQTTAPWSGNRFGDPRQLVYEADKLEQDARGRRAHANYLRRIASEADTQADRLDEAARDYRQWAKARETMQDG